MATNETSWADQWDPQPMYSYPANTGSGNSASKFSDKTKTGVKKVKSGATAGFQWVKNKYQKATHKQ